MSFESSAIPWTSTHCCMPGCSVTLGYRSTFSSQNDRCILHGLQRIGGLSICDRYCKDHGIQLLFCNAVAPAASSTS